AIGSLNAVLTVRPAANGAPTIWAANSAHPVRTPRAVPAADGDVTIPSGAVASALYQAAYFQAVDNPTIPQHDLANVLLADVAAQVYATNPNADPGAVETGLAALKSAFDHATNPQVPASAGKGLPSFGPTLVPQLTGALGVMSTFAKSSGAGVVGPAAVAVATSVYNAYLKTSIATGIGFSTGYAGFSDRSLYDVSDLTASGFHALVSGPAIEQAVACGQANPACATVEDSLLTPVIHTGLGTTDAISVTQTPAQLQTADPTLATMLSSQQLNVPLNSDGSLTLPSGGYDAMLTRAGSMNQALVTSDSSQIHALVQAAGDPASPTDVSGQAGTDLTGALPIFDFTLTGTLFTNGIRNLASPDGGAKDKPLLDGSALAQDTTILLKAFGINNSTLVTAFSDIAGIYLDLITENYADAIKNLFGVIGALTASPAKDEALTLAQQTDNMIQQVFTALTTDLNQVEKSIQNVEATLIDVFKAMQAGFADIDFQTGEILAGLNGVEFTLGQLQYQTDLVDADVVAFGQGQIQSKIQGTINQCLDRTARNLSPLDFPEFSDCASQFKTEALTDANNDVVEFSTPPPPVAPGNGDFSPDGTVLTALGQHGLNQAQDLAYLLGILHKWYGIGTDPATLSPALVNPGVWSEVALGYRELLDEYPQFSAGDEPDLSAIQAPGQQIAQLISAIQQVDPTTGINPAVDKFTGNYHDAFAKLVADIAAHHASFPTGLTGAAGGYGTPSGQQWHGYNAFADANQAVPAGDVPNTMLSSLPNCSNGNSDGLGSPMAWESAASLPNSYYLLYNLVGYANGSLQPLSSPVCYTFADTISDKHCITVKGVMHCTWTETDSGSMEVRFEGTDGAVHILHAYKLPSAVFDCQDGVICNTFTEAGFIANRIVNAGGLAPLLASITPTTTSLDVLASEGTAILAAEQKQNYQWDINAFTDPNTPDHATLLIDSENMSGAFELLQLLAQTVAPAASLGNQALADILYGQDQLPTTLTGPNGPSAVFVALRDGTGTQTLTDYANGQQSRLAELETLINGNLGSDQQAAAGSARSAHAPRTSSRQVTAALPPPSDLATGEAPVLTYSVLAQLATGALFDTDTVTVTSPGTLTSGRGTAVSVPLSASSSAGASITSWSATGLPPGLSISSSTGNVTGTPTTTGTFTVTVTATDTVGSSEHDSGQVTFTWVISSKTPPVCGKQLIGNGGFESGISPWKATSGVRIATAKATPAFAGKWLARLGGRKAPRKDTLSQTVTIQPSCGSATLSFELRVITNDPKTKASDTLKVQVVSASGAVLKTLATFSNKNASAKYAKHTFSLKPFIGQKVTIRFASNETLKGHATSFLIDNVAVPVS
ncbi:MAG TPA: putative Ig domain-containing protein, partial [Streptosporangiaceae bacterium]|nr:putative Ig domain-containing protein [Streptosporangiaceae bacterium]